MPPPYYPVPKAGVMRTMKWGAALPVPPRSPVCTLGSLLPHPASMAAQGEERQSGHDFRELDNRPYTTHSPFLRLIPGSGDRGPIRTHSQSLLSLAQVLMHHHSPSTPKSLPPTSFSSPASFKPLSARLPPVFLLTVFSQPRSGHLLSLATVPDTKAHQEHLLVGSHAATQASLSRRLTGCGKKCRSLRVWESGFQSWFWLRHCVTLGKFFHVHASRFPHFIK